MDHTQHTAHCTAARCKYVCNNEKNQRSWKKHVRRFVAVEIQLCRHFSFSSFSSLDLFHILFGRQFRRNRVHTCSQLDSFCVTIKILANVFWKSLTPFLSQDLCFFKLTYLLQSFSIQTLLIISQTAQNFQVHFSYSTF